MIGGENNENKQRFTLIELLAVIVILAIIALIAVPIVLKAIDKAQQGSAKSTANSYLQAVDFTVQMEQISAPEKVPFDATSVNVNFGNTAMPDNVPIEMKNAASVATETKLIWDPASGNYNGQVVTKNKYCAKVENNEIVEIEKNSIDCDQ